MKVIVQRVQQASVSVEQQCVGQIAQGVLLLVGIGHHDTESDLDYMVRKITQLRIFDDEQGVMNCSLIDKGYSILAVSQFTLLAQTKKGNRPSYADAARPEVALPLFNLFVNKLSQAIQKPVPTGQFGAYMQVSLINDGPVTILLETSPS